MALNLSTESIARASSRRPWTTIGIWVVVFIKVDPIIKTA